MSTGSAKSPRVGLRATLGMGLGAAAIGVGAYVSMLPGTPPLEVALVGLSAVVGALLGAWVCRPARGARLELGPWLVVGPLSVGVAIWGFFADASAGELVAGAAQASGALAVMVSLLRWAQSKLTMNPGVRRPKKVLVRREKDKKASKVLVAKLAPGDAIEIESKQIIPVDGRVIDGTASIDVRRVTGAKDKHSCHPGDVVLAGTIADGPLVIEVENTVDHCYIDRRRRRTSSMSARLSASTRSGKTLAAVVSLASFAVVGGFWILHPDLPLAARVFASLGLLLAAGAAVPGLALARGRVEAFDRLLDLGVSLGSPQELDAMTRVRRWTIAGELLAAPGAAEAVAFADLEASELLRIAGALLAEDGSPPAISLRERLSSLNLEPYRGAALKPTRGVYHGTVQGQRWYLGPPAAVEEEEGAELDRSMKAALEYLGSRGPILWILGRADIGPVGALALDVSTRADVREVAQKLGASLLPGLPDVVRGALAESAQIKADGAPLKPRDGSLIAYRDLAPSAGLAVRVIDEDHALALDFGSTPLIFRAALGRLPEVVQHARRARRRASVQAVVLTLLPLSVAAVFSMSGYFGPMFGAAIGLLAVASAARWVGEEALNRPKLARGSAPAKPRQ